MLLEQQCMNAWNHPLSQTCPPTPNAHSLTAISACVCVSMSLACVHVCVKRKSNRCFWKQTVKIDCSSSSGDLLNSDLASRPMWHFAKLHHGYPAAQTGYAVNRPEQHFLSAHIRNEGRATCSGGLFLITIPQTRECTCTPSRAVMNMHALKNKETREKRALPMPFPAQAAPVGRVWSVPLQNKAC